MSHRKTRVAIIGGGCAAMAAAWSLTDPAQRDQFDVTVYQQGWRLGGKGASGRGADGRIEEHGLHIWMGHYHNAFRIMRECYAELARDPASCPIADWRDAFVPDPNVGVTELASDGRWRMFMASFPPLDGVPGDPDAITEPRRDARHYIGRTIALVIALLESSFDSAEKDREELGDLQNAMQRFLSYGGVVSLTAALQGLRTLELLVRETPGLPDSLINDFVDGLVATIQALLSPMLQDNAESQYVWEIIDLVLANVRGYLRYRLFDHPDGFDAIDDWESKDWLLHNGASERSVNSAFIRGLYDLCFAYEQGDPERPRLAAGQSLRGATRMFWGYRGALFWKMQAGMGDVVFAPFYEALTRRGARFEFFHRLKNLRTGPAQESPHISELQFQVQAVTADGTAYRPLVDVRGLPCWPSVPNWEQLNDGAELARRKVDFESAWDDTHCSEKTLQVGKDFDLVILAVGLGEVPRVASELLAQNTAWRNMVQHLGLVPTQAFQVWLKADLEQLGWTSGSANISGFVEPFDTWADMSHLAALEAWPRQPDSIAYFCNTLHQPATTEADLANDAFPAEQHARVRETALNFMNAHMGHLWPNATHAGGFEWNLVEKGSTDDGEHPFDSQFWTANVNPTDLYVQTLPGTDRYRISPLEQHWDNLTIAGDWTNSGFNLGCVEGAVMSGLLASHALSRYPRLEDIHCFDHP